MTMTMTKNSTANVTILCSLVIYAWVGVSMIALGTTAFCPSKTTRITARTDFTNDIRLSSRFIIASSKANDMKQYYHSCSKPGFSARTPYHAMRSNACITSLSANNSNNGSKNEDDNDNISGKQKEESSTDEPMANTSALKNSVNTSKNTNGIDDDSTQMKNDLSIKNIFWNGVIPIVSTFFIGAGGFFAIGIVLNSLGYGYYFSKEEGLRIDTKTELKMEQQLLQSTSSRPASSSQLESQTSSTAAVAAIGKFLKEKPFVATSLVTAGAILVEQIIPSSKDDKEDK